MPPSVDLMDTSNSALIPLDQPSANAFIPQWALSPPNMTQLHEYIEQLQSYHKKHAQALSELQKLATIAQRSTLSRPIKTDGEKGPDEVEEQAPALVLIDCASLTFAPELVQQGREGGKKFIDNLTRKIEADYAKTKKPDDAKEIWTCFELFVSEKFAEGDSVEGQRMKAFIKGVTDAINVKLVRVYDDNTTNLAWKLAVTAQNWFERNSVRYCYVASCDEKTYGCFNSASRTRLKLLAQQEADPEDIDDLEEWEETRKRRAGFELVDVGELLMPKGLEEESFEVIGTSSPEIPHNGAGRVPERFEENVDSARDTPRRSLAPPRSAYDLVKHIIGETARIKVGSEIAKQPVTNKTPTSAPTLVGHAVLPVRPAPSLAVTPSRIGPALSVPTAGSGAVPSVPHVQYIPLPEPPHPRDSPLPPKVGSVGFSRGFREFQPLYKILVDLNKEYRAHRYHQAGQVGQRLSSADYRRSGYRSYKDYVMAAERAGLVKVLVEGSALWIALNVAQAQHSLAIQGKPEATVSRVGSSSDPVWLPNLEEETNTPRTIGSSHWVTEPMSPPMSLI